MLKHLSHKDWVIRQFDVNDLRSSYRNVILHASIIEGTVRNVSSQGKFKQANDSLKKSRTITPEEYRAFEEVRDVRNKLVHESFKDGYTQDEIEDSRDTLMKKILTAYRISTFLDNRLFKKYGIPRPPKIDLKLPA